jgi:hypothetical protein
MQWTQAKAPLTNGATQTIKSKLVHAAMNNPMGINGVAHREDHHLASGSD